MSTVEGALDTSGAFGVGTDADTKIGNFFWRSKLNKKLFLRTLTLFFSVWFIIFSFIIFPVSASSAATKPADSTIKIGYIGDSISVGLGSDGSPSAVQTEISLLGDKYEAVNEGVVGMATNQWLPGGENFDKAVADFQQKDVTVVSIMLGTNDVRNDQMTTSPKYLSNMRTIIHGLLATGTIKVVILNYPPYISLGKLDQWSNDSQLRLESYLKDIDKLINGKTVLLGDTSSYNYFATHQDQLVDGVHPNAAGHAYLGALWAASYTKLFADRNDSVMPKQLTPALLQK